MHIISQRGLPLIAIGRKSYEGYSTTKVKQQMTKERGKNSNILSVVMMWLDTCSWKLNQLCFFFFFLFIVLQSLMSQNQIVSFYRKVVMKSASWTGQDALSGRKKRQMPYGFKGWAACDPEPWCVCYWWQHSCIKTVPRSPKQQFPSLYTWSKTMWDSEQTALWVAFPRDGVSQNTCC